MSCLHEEKSSKKKSSPGKDIPCWFMSATVEKKTDVSASRAVCNAHKFKPHKALVVG